jgi:hypothetical protein
MTVQFSNRVRAALLAAASFAALTAPAGGACPLTADNDVCDVTDATDQLIAANAGDGLDDLLRLGGAAAFNFAVPGLGTVFTNFERFEKDGAADVTLTGDTGLAVDWTIRSGRLLTGLGNTIADTGRVSIEAAGAFVVSAVNETVGSVVNRGRVTVAAGRKLLVAGGFDNVAGAIFSGDMDVAGTLTNLGLLSAGASPGIINAAAYAGGGAMDVEVQFNTAAAPVNGVTHDFLNIAGAATGVTLIRVLAIGPSDDPFATVGDGIEVVRVGLASARDTFRLSEPALQGGFQYLLRRAGSDAGPASFFLQSVVREELVAHAVATAASRTTMRALAFADQGLAAAEGIGAKLRAWLSVHGGVEQAGGDAGARFNSDFWGVTAGVDSGFTSNVRLGIKGGWGRTNTDLFMPQGTAGLEGDTYFAQVYGQFVSGQFFADADAGYAWTDWDFRRSVLAGTASETFDGVIASLGAGYRFEFEDPIKLTLTGRVMYDGTNCGHNCFLAGAREDTSDWYGRVSARLERPYLNGKFRPYLAVSLTDDFGDGQTVRLGRASVRADTQNAVLGVGAGFNADLAPNMHLFVDGGLTQSLDTDVKGFQGQVGFRMTW